MTDLKEAKRMIVVNQWITGLCLVLLLMAMSMQLTLGNHTAFTLAMNTITVGGLGMSVSALGKAIRSLRRIEGHGDQEV